MFSPCSAKRRASDKDLPVKHELYFIFIFKIFHFGLPAQSIAFCLEIITGISATERLRWFHCQGYLRNQLLKLKNEWLLAEIDGVTRLKLNTFQFRREHAAGKLVIAIGPHFLCWHFGVVPFNTWLISSWEETKCCYKLSKCSKWHLFHSNWSKLSFGVKKVVILSVAQLVTTVTFF